MTTSELQIRIKDEKQTQFTSRNGRFSKMYFNAEELNVYFEYKTFDGMIKAAKKIANENTIVIVWDSLGCGERTTIDKI